MGSHSSKAPSLQESIYCKTCAANLESDSPPPMTINSIQAQSAKLNNKPVFIASPNNNNEDAMQFNLANLIESATNPKRQPSMHRYFPHPKQSYIQKSYIQQPIPLEPDFHHVVPLQPEMLEYNQSISPVPVPLALPSSFNSKTLVNPYKEQKIVYRPPAQFKFLPKQTTAARNDVATYYSQLLPNQCVQRVQRVQMV